MGSRDSSRATSRQVSFFAALVAGEKISYEAAETFLGQFRGPMEEGWEPSEIEGSDRSKDRRATSRHVSEFAALVDHGSVSDEEAETFLGQYRYHGYD